MLSSLMSGLFDKEKAVFETIQAALKDVAEEQKCSFKEIFIVIKPMDSEFNHKYFVCKFDEKGNQKVIREMTLKEILGDD